MPGKFRKPWSRRSNALPATAVEQLPPGTKAESNIQPHENNAELNDMVEEVAQFEQSHQWDPNLPQTKMDVLHEAAKTGDIEKIKEVESDFAEDSPHEEVRAAVKNTDDGGVANTVRAWILGIIFVTIGSGLNMLLSMR
jgi:hypothetical protein